MLTEREPRTHGRLFYRMVRNRVKDHLALSGKFPSDDAIDAAVDRVPDQEIDGYAEAAGIVGALGDGSLLQWIKDHKAEIIKVIMMIVSILLMFAERPPTG